MENNSFLNKCSIIVKTEKNNFEKYICEQIITLRLINSCIYFKNLSLSFKNNNYLLNTSSPCIIKFPLNNETYILNIRCVNYRINKYGVSLKNDNNNTYTLNILFILDRNFNVLSKNIKYPEDNNKIYVGIEDIRLFNLNNKIYYIGSCYNNSNGNINIVSNELDINNNYIEKFIQPTFKTNFKWEKNWVFFENNGEPLIIYKWYPITICKIDYEKQELNLLKEIQTPQIFYDFRGSTNGVWHNNKLWFIVHSQIEIKNKKQYFHRFVLLHPDLTVCGYSNLFKFENFIVEFCVGMEITYNNNFVITYSTLDRTSKMVVFTPEHIISLIKYI